MQQKFVKNFFIIRDVTIIFFVFLTIFAVIIAILKEAAVAVVPIFSLMPITYIVFAIVFYDTIFQTILIDEKGISIMFFGKTMCIYDWESIIVIEEYSFNGGSKVYRIEKNDGGVIFLDNRKKIKTAIETYYHKRILPKLTGLK